MAEITDLQQRLAVHQEAFAESSADNGGGFVVDWPPDGTYQAVVKSFDFFEGKSSGDVFLKTVLQVMFDRDHQGKEVETIHNLTDPDLLKAGWLKKHLDRLGADAENIDLGRDIGPGSEILASLLDVPVEIAIKTSDRTDDNGQPYRNVYVNKRLGDALAPGGPGVVGGPRVGGQVVGAEGEPEVPADTSGFGAETQVSGTANPDDDIPF